MFYRGYVQTVNKRCKEKLKGRTEFNTLDQVKNEPEYAGILAEDAILIDIDDSEQSEILMDIVEELQLDCKVICTARGKHFLFKNYKLDNGAWAVDKCKSGVTLAVGLKADIKVGHKISYEVLKVDGTLRHVEWDIEEGETYQNIPRWLHPITGKADFINMEKGEGRNQSLYTYILKLQTNGFSKEEVKECIRTTNEYLFKEPLSDEELEVILRDEAFQKPIFFKDKTFLFDKFAIYLQSNYHIVKINNQLHMYKDGVYENGYAEIESAMITKIPNLKKTQRREVIDYLTLIAPTKKPSDSRYIAFNNGLYDMESESMVDFSADIVILNKIPWDYNPDAYSELADNMLNKLSCNDKEIRALLEECIGACLYRDNSLGGGKAFILTGGGSNGKSTFIDCLKAILDTKNISSLELKELGDRFSTSMMFGKLANLSDDISDDFLQGNQISVFKKVVTSNRIKAERKGQDPFEFEPYCSVIASANDIPRTKDKTGAVLRRMLIIPFNAKFSKNDADFDPFIKLKLVQQEPVEYMITLGLKGLRRVLENSGFTNSKVVQEQIELYERENNPIIGFISDCDVETEIFNQQTKDVYRAYSIYCSENGLNPMANVTFGRTLCAKLGLETKLERRAGKPVRVFQKV